MIVLSVGDFSRKKFWEKFRGRGQIGALNPPVTANRSSLRWC